MSKQKKLEYWNWIRDLCVGDEVIVSGHMILISPLYRSVPLVCRLKSKTLGSVCIVEKISDQTIRVAGRYFRLDTGTNSTGNSKYRLKIYPCFDTPVNPTTPANNLKACEA